MACGRLGRTLLLFAITKDVYLRSILVVLLLGTGTMVKSSAKR